MIPNLLTTSQAAEQLGVARRWVSALIRRGSLPAHFVGGMYFIRPQDLAAFTPKPRGRPRKDARHLAKRPKGS